ncbi:MAG: hypothetical protein ABR975_04390 [Vulcanimicrobiaceae bacterium]
MTLRRTLAALVAAAGLAGVPIAAWARPSAVLDGGTVVFFADTLTVIARGSAALRLDDGTRASADAIAVDLKTDRVVLAGHARIARGTLAVDADAIALDLDDTQVDLLDLVSGDHRTTRALGPATDTPIDPHLFAFPDVVDRYAYIRARHADITPHANVRFRPAAFPTSVGAVPVPSYMYTYATSAGFGASSLPAADFDQPYGLWGTPYALTTIHGRWIDGLGPDVGFQEQLANGDTEYATASYDQPLRGSPSTGFDAYRRMNQIYTISAEGTDAYGYWSGQASLGAAFGQAGGRVTFVASSFGESSFDTSLRTPDMPLLGGTTLRLTADIGYDARHGGLLTVLPDASHYGTVWRHSLDAFLATPVVRGPLRTRIGATLEGTRTWYAYPHHYDEVTAATTVSRQFSRAFTMLATYQNSWTAEIYPYAQALFYPIPSPPLLAPDGTSWVGYDAYDGVAVARSTTVTAQLTPNVNTSAQLAVTRNDDFLQFGGFGPAPWAVTGTLRLRPFPNIGLQVSRGYAFDWGGVRWIPRWSIAITP